MPGDHQAVEIPEFAGGDADFVFHEKQFAGGPVILPQNDNLFTLTW
jgi:hypothetical protein